MRRPMAVGGVLFSLLLLVLLQLHPLWWGKEQALSEKEVYFEGNLYEKEYRIRGGQKVPVLYLEDVLIYDVLPQSGGKTGDSLPQKIPYKIMCYMESEEDAARLGSRLLVCGTMKNFQSASNSGMFDSARYYQILGVGAKAQDCRIAAQQGEGDRVKAWLYALKECASRKLHGLLDEEDASVMGSLLLGESALLDKEIKDLYKQSGIIHILAISGLHISLLGMGVFKLLRKCGAPIEAGAGTAAVVVFMFVLMTGAGPSSLRAAIMFGMQMAAYFLGRTYDMPTGLALAAVLILSVQPLYLYHSGFMLSFLSVASLIALQPAFAEIFPGKLAPGLAVFMGTLPAHAWFYYEAAPYALFLNLLILPCMPVLMVLGLILLAAGTVFPAAASLPAEGIHLLLQLYRYAGEGSLKIPGNRWVIGKPAIYQVLLYLTILVIVVLAGEYVPNLWPRMACCLAVLVLVSDMHTGLQLTAVDVGQGDCFLVTDHRKVSILIDGGSSSEKNAGEYRIQPLLKYNGIGCLDAVFISHLDSDHYNGILELIEKTDEGGTKIGSIVVSGAEQGEKLRELAELAAVHGITVKAMVRGGSFCSGRLALACLYPSGEAGYGGSGSANGNSMVLFLRYGSFTALFTGDLEMQEEMAVADCCRELLQDRPLTVLKVAHHGSKNSTSSAFLEALSPRLALISAGEGNSYGHPHAETLDRLEAVGATVYRTDECGEVTVLVKGGKAEVVPYIR